MEKLSHLFESNVKVFEAPKVFKAAQFTSPGSKLEIKEVEWINPGEGGQSHEIFHSLRSQADRILRCATEIVVRVNAVGLHST